MIGSLLSGIAALVYHLVSCACGEGLRGDGKNENKTTI
jgi:hypothetical protein